MENVGRWSRRAGAGVASRVSDSFMTCVLVACISHSKAALRGGENRFWRLAERCPLVIWKARPPDWIR